MPVWSEILRELAQSKTEQGGPDYDGIRRKYLVQAYQHTQRNIILYASRFTQPDPGIPPELVSIVDEDMQGIMEVSHGLNGPKLDLILHSPGGTLEVAEAIVTYLRSRFKHIRVIVPHLAMSAATMIACAADVILMGKHSFLGPTDPQLLLNTPLGARMVPVEAILEQFEQAKNECKDAAKMGAWLPMLSQYGPDLLVQCRNARDLARTLVERWLKTYMFRKRADREEKAKEAAEWLTKHGEHKSHGRHLPRSEVRQKLRVDYLEKDEMTQDLFLSVFHATTLTFTNTIATKIIENQLGKAFIKMQQVIPIRMPQPQQIAPSEAGPKK